MNEFKYRLSVLLCIGLTCLCFWKAGQGLGLLDRQASANASVVAKSWQAPIQDLWPGMRVVGRNPLVADTERGLPDPEPKSWRLLTLRLEHKPGAFVGADMGT